MSNKKNPRIGGADELELAYLKMNQVIENVEGELSQRPASEIAMFNLALPTVGELEGLGKTVSELKAVRVGFRKIEGI